MFKALSLITAIIVLSSISLFSQEGLSASARIENIAKKLDAMKSINDMDHRFEFSVYLDTTTTDKPSFLLDKPMIENFDMMLNMVDEFEMRFSVRYFKGGKFRIDVLSGTGMQMSGVVNGKDSWFVDQDGKVDKDDKRSIAMLSRLVAMTDLKYLSGLIKSGDKSKAEIAAVDLGEYDKWPAVKLSLPGSESVVIGYSEWTGIPEAVEYSIIQGKIPMKITVRYYYNENENYAYSSSFNVGKEITGNIPLDINNISFVSGFEEKTAILNLPKINKTKE